MYRGYKYVIKVVEGEACVYQGNRLVLFLIRRGDPPVWTSVTSTRTPDQLHRKGGEHKK